MFVNSHSIHFFFFFFNDTATTEIYTLSLHDALPICQHGRTRSGLSRSDHGGGGSRREAHQAVRRPRPVRACGPDGQAGGARSEEHTSELQSRLHLVCRLLLEKKNTIPLTTHPHRNSN